jgi:polyisoprenoid-binding protein YceI
MIKKILSAIAIVTTITFLPSAKFHTEAYNVDLNTASVHWLGKKVTGQHDGFVKLKSGVLIMNHGTPEAGKFELDMTSLTCADIKDEKQNANLVKHLKNDDFFCVEKHPVATLTITRIVPIAGAKAGENNFELFANLAIKGINKPIQFPARFDIFQQEVKATAKITIDRTQWDISYKSGTVFPSLADKAIADNIEFDVNVTARNSHHH